MTIFSTEFKSLAGRGHQVIIAHIGSNSGFVEEGLKVFKTQMIGACHEDMKWYVFETWFKSVLFL